MGAIGGWRIRSIGAISAACATASLLGPRFFARAFAIASHIKGLRIAVFETHSCWLSLSLSLSRSLSLSLSLSLSFSLVISALTRPPLLPHTPHHVGTKVVLKGVGVLL